MYSNVFYISEQRQAPKHCGARGSLPPYPTLSTGLNIPLMSKGKLCTPLIGLEGWLHVRTSVFYHQ